MNHVFQFYKKKQAIYFFFVKILYGRRIVHDKKSRQLQTFSW